MQKMRFEFEWDPAKARSNRRKHGVSFELATTVFRDPNAVSIYDLDHSDDEERWITMGIAASGATIVVHHTFEPVNQETVVIRLFSCRKPTKREQRQYAELSDEKGI